MTLKLKYETGVAVTAQFIIITILNFANGLSSAVRQCMNNSGNCVSNIILSLLYFLLVSVWFGALWVTGLAAQDRRSKRICKLLISGEGLVFLVALFDLTHHNPSLLGQITSFADGLTAFWVTMLAFRLLIAKGGRVRSRARVRKHPQGHS